MSEIDDGGAAFPMTQAFVQTEDGAKFVNTGGLSRRDYFAAAALTGLGTWTPDPDIGLGDTPATYDMVSTVKRRARWAVAQADALIAASKTGGPEHG